MKRYFAGVDIGGTHICGALINSSDGNIYRNKVSKIAVDAQGSASEIFQAWQTLVLTLLNEPVMISGIGFAIPGPFNYADGICAIEGVRKYDALFGINICEEIRKIFPNRSLPVAFINDASGFAMGEFYAGAAQESSRTLVVTLGTGFGSTFLNNGTVQTCGADVPPNGYLYNIRYKKSIADDYFSTRWIVWRWEELTGEKVSEAKPIAEKALAGNEKAIALFDEFAKNLAEFISPFLNDFQADTFVIGGNIARVSGLFLPQLIENLNRRGLISIRVKTCELWEKAPIIGAAMQLKAFQLSELERKTDQFLAPEKAQPTLPGQYDIYPVFPLGFGKIESGVSELSQWIAEQKSVVIDCYEGVCMKQLVAQLADELNKTGKKIRWRHIETALHSSEKIEEIIRPYMGEENSIFGKITDKSLIDFFDADKLKKIQPDEDADINILVGCGAALAGWNAPLIYADLPKNELQFRMRAGSALNLGADTTYDSRVMYKRAFFVDWVVLNKHKANLLPDIEWIIDAQRPCRLLSMRGADLREGLSEMSRNFFRVRPWFEPGSWGGTWMRNRIEGLNKEVNNLAWSFELMVAENGLMFESDGYRLEVSFDFLMFNNYREVLGDCAERFKYDFPIRFDFLDTFDGGNLSVQCHPRPEYIKEQFGMPFTQDETYYILDCQNEPVVYLGFQEGIDSEMFHLELIKSEKTASPVDIEKYVQKHPAKKHDLFLIPNGTVHASGKDNLVLEISSAPYIFTFKMYDWMRLDLDGRPRPINIEHGMKNLYFERQGQKVIDEHICRPTVIDQNGDATVEHLHTHPAQFYDVHRYTFSREIQINSNNKCHVWMLVEGRSVTVETAEGRKQRFNYAETFVIPAAAKSYVIRNEGDGKAIMVKAFVKH
ncbi:MAG: ROK family protein [Dysgonamonadaceae bacterium]|nr:ROK family protein [Dysgonamonadaceae bacterium]